MSISSALVSPSLSESVVVAWRQALPPPPPVPEPPAGRITGDFESFVEWQLTGATSDADALAALATDPTLGDVEALRAEYERWQLLDDWVGEQRAASAG